MKKALSKNKHEPSIIRPLNEINQKLLEELNLCIKTFNTTTNELKEYFQKNLQTNSEKYMFIVNPKEDCLMKMINEINKRKLDPMQEWFEFFQSQKSTDFDISQIEQRNGVHLSNYICILKKKLKHNLENKLNSNFKIKSVFLDTHNGTGFEKDLYFFIKKKFNDNKFKKMNQNDIMIDRIICTYYSSNDDNNDNYDNFLYASYQMPFYDYVEGNCRFIYYLTMDNNYKMINECVLCSKFGQINYNL